MYQHVKIRQSKIIHEAKEVQRWEEEKKNQWLVCWLLVKFTLSILTSSSPPSSALNNLIIKSVKNTRDMTISLKKDDHLSYDNEKAHLFLVLGTEVLPAC